MVVAGCRRFCCCGGHRRWFLFTRQFDPMRFQIKPAQLLCFRSLHQLHYDIRALAAEEHFCFRRRSRRHRRCWSVVFFSLGFRFRRIPSFAVSKYTFQQLIRRQSLPNKTLRTGHWLVNYTAPKTSNFFCAAPLAGCLLLLLYE